MNLIVYYDQKTIKTFVGDVGTINNVKMIMHEDEIYLNMKDLAEMFCLESEADELLKIYTYRKVE